MSSKKIDYRKIWEDANGTIPKDENGISYEIHHVDGNRSNNDLSNLKCVSIQEHYNIHFEQSDFYACASILKRLSLSEQERKLLSDKIGEANKTRVWSTNSRQKLSKAIKGTINVKDSRTGTIIGRVSKEHEKVKNGEWVHTSKGIKRPDHSSYMKQRGFGKTKTSSQIKKHRESWLATTGGTIRAEEWVILYTKSNKEITIKNLKKFCRENQLPYGKIRKGEEINGVLLRGKLSDQAQDKTCH